MGNSKSQNGAVEIDMEAGEVAAIRTARRSGNSIVVSLPPAVLSAAGIERGDDISVTARPGGEIALRPETPPGD